MDARQQKGQEIADKASITRKGHLWLVPSQNGGGAYTVNLESDKPHCTCRDHEFRRAVCKHIVAVQVTVERIKTVTTTTIEAEGVKAITTETVETVKVKRTTYKQEWKQYNAAQAYEKSEFLALLYGLTNGVDEPVQTFVCKRSADRAFRWPTLSLPSSIKSIQRFPLAALLPICAMLFKRAISPNCQATTRSLTICKCPN